MKRPYINLPGLSEFRREMERMGCPDPGLSEDVLRQLSHDILAQGRAEYWWTEADRLQGTVDVLARRYRSLRTCALLIAAVLATLALVGWLR